MVGDRQVVVISSSPDRRAQLRDWLSGLGVDVQLARSCEEACRWCQKMAGPCIIVTDVSLSDGNWYLVLKRIVDSGKSCEFVVASDSPVPSERMRASGVDWVLSEPLDQAQVLTTVKRAMSRFQPAAQTARSDARHAAGGGSLGGEKFYPAARFVS
jgi:CheY-like chemotaxis protein